MRTSRHRRNRRENAVGIAKRLPWFLLMKSVFTLSMLGVVAWSILTLVDPATQPVKEVRIHGGGRYLDPKELKQLIVNHVRGGFFSLDVDSVRKRLLGNAWVQDVRVKRSWPAMLLLEVKQRRPIARWGENGFIDSNGVPFYPEHSLDVPGLVGLQGPAGSEARVLKALLNINQRLKDHGQRVEWLSLSERGGWSFGLLRGPEVIIGRTNFDTRLQRFDDGFRDFFLEHLEDIKVVDLRYSNGFAVRSYADISPQQG